MTVSVHVDPCPTCHGTGLSRSQMLRDPNRSPRKKACPDCPIVPGYQVPEWVKVPMVDVLVYDGPAAPNIAVWETQPQAHPDWRPGASVTLTATCPGPAHDGIGGEYYCDRGCNTGKVPVGSAVIAELLQCFDAGDPDYYEQADHISLSDDPADVPAEIWRYVGVGKGEAGPFNIEPVSHLPACKPDDTLARLETP